jgi:putative spermidine/putrescine transport system ATP-binding protein
MDEPLGALDKQLRELMQLELRHLQRRLNITVIYVTHDQAEALTMSDRIAVMSRGRIEQIGSPSELYNRPVNRFVASFLGESNLFEGTVVGVEAGHAIVRTDRGLIVRVRSTGLREESRVTLSVRPEKIVVCNPDPPNAFPGLIKELIYLGDAIKLRLELPGGDTVLAKEQNRRSAPLPGDGEVVRVGWGIDDTIVL